MSKSDDLISRQDAVSEIDEWIQRSTDNETDMAVKEFLSFLKERIDTLPSAEARPTGEWIPEKDTGETMLKCSECECRVIEKWYRMAVGTNADKCPYCGAYMITRRRETDGKKKNTV